jgi:hypothetical protein
MAKYEHTPGPWSRSGGCILDKRGNLVAARYSWKALNADGYSVEVRGREDAIEPVEADANAHLIAAAPELEDALKLYVAIDNDRRAGIRITKHRWAEAHQAASSALAKAAYD